MTESGFLTRQMPVLLGRTNFDPVNSGYLEANLGCSEINLGFLKVNLGCLEVKLVCLAVNLEYPDSS